MTTDRETRLALYRFQGPAVLAAGKPTQNLLPASALGKVHVITGAVTQFPNRLLLLAGELCTCSPKH